jgi:hypothetical protein
MILIPGKLTKRHGLNTSKNLDKEGIKAIIELQALAGITETEEQAAAGWLAMNDREKAKTLSVHRMLCKKQGDIGSLVKSPIRSGF